MIPQFTAEAALLAARRYRGAGVTSTSDRDETLPFQPALDQAMSCTCPCCIVHDCYWGLWVCTDCC